MTDAIGPLAGLVVVDLSRALAGPHAAMLLGDLGARVIKVEPPGGDETRGWGPPFVTGADRGEHSTYFLSCNRNKESIVLDLKTPEGKRTLERLIARADVLVENFRVGVLDRLGFGLTGLTARYPRLVALSITGLGHDGPEADRPGYDQIAQGEAGLMSITGPSAREPSRVGVPIGDLLAGIYGALGVVAALQSRHNTGRGQIVRTSLLAGIVATHAFQGTRWTVGGEVPVASGNHHPSITPYGSFPSSDGFVQIAVGSDGLWQRFAPDFGLDRPEWAANRQRVRDSAAVIAAVTDAFASWTTAALLQRLRGLGIPAGQIRRIDEVYEWEQTRSQGLLLEVEHPALGRITLPGPALRAEGFGRRHAAPPLLDEHGGIIRAWLDDADRHLPGTRGGREEVRPVP